MMITLTSKDSRMTSDSDTARLHSLFVGQRCGTERKYRNQKEQMEKEKVSQTRSMLVVSGEGWDSWPSMRWGWTPPVHFARRTREETSNPARVAHIAICQCEQINKHFSVYLILFEASWRKKKINFFRWQKFRKDKRNEISVPNPSF